MFTEEKRPLKGQTFKYTEIPVREKPRYKNLRKVQQLPEFNQLSFVQILLESIR